MNKLTDCLIVFAPVNGSIFIENCQNCKFVIASQQLRIHGAHNTTFYVYSRSHPIIEDSDHLWFSPYHFAYSKREEQFQECNFDMQQNKWEQVEDFNWQKVGIKSPHWSILYNEHIETFHLPQ